MVVDADLWAESLAWAAKLTSSRASATSSVRPIDSVAFVVAAAFAFELVASFHDGCCRSFAIDV